MRDEKASQVLASLSSESTKEVFESCTASAMKTDRHGTWSVVINDLIKRFLAETIPQESRDLVARVT